MTKILLVEDDKNLREIYGVRLLAEGYDIVSAGDVNASNEYIRFSVSDTGIGIPPEDIPHLFQKFYRVDNSEST